MNNNQTNNYLNATKDLETKRGIWFIMKLILPKSTNEDDKRREFILNVFLISSMVFSLIALFTLLIYIIKNSFLSKIISSGIPVTLALLIFVLLYYLSRKGFFITAAYFFTTIYFLAATYTVYQWGVDLPMGILLYALIIVMSGVLVGTRFAFLVTIITSLTLLLLTYLQTNFFIVANKSWKNETMATGDALVFAVTFIIIAIVSWLSNREIEKSLKRARTSETTLKQERDLLEVRVEERTQELKKAQLEKMSQLYHFAEFGRLASGLFHDLVNPLTVVSFSLEELSGQAKEKRSKALVDMASILQHAISGTRRMQAFIDSVRKQIQQQETKEDFSAENEIAQVIQLLSFKAKEQSVKISFSPTTHIETYGDPVKFYKVISNIVSNAVDSYEERDEKETEKNKKREILIKASLKDNITCIEIQDWGVGITPEHLKRIFEPFFTTKSIEKGTGLGLSICKNIIEGDFDGHIYVKSKLGQGTTFTIEFPIRKNKDLLV